jgi:hypothetical protein
MARYVFFMEVSSNILLGVHLFVESSSNELQDVHLSTELDTLEWCYNFWLGKYMAACGAIDLVIFLNNLFYAVLEPIEHTWESFVTVGKVVIYFRKPSVRRKQPANRLVDRKYQTASQSSQ